MRKLLSIIALILLAAFAATAQTPTASPSASTSQTAQTADPGFKRDGVVGDISSVDAAQNQMIVKTEGGATVGVLLTDKTAFKRIPPGVTTIDKAEDIKLTDFGVGDRVYARGRVSADRKVVQALQVLVMKQADITQKNEREKQEWRTRGVLGTVTAINPATKEITLQARTREGAKPMTVVVSDKTTFRRYAPDSVLFKDAKVSSLSEIQVGDQMRALGQRSEDGAHYQADQIVSGAFKTLAGTVTAVNAAANEVTVTELQNPKQKLTVIVNKDSNLRRIPPQMAMMFAQRGQGGGPAGGTGAGGPGGPGGGPRPQNPEGGRPAGGPGGPGGEGRMGGGFGAGNMNLQDMIDRLPQLNISELKPGDVVVFLSTKGSEPTRATAITLISGLEPIIRAQAAANAAAGRSGASSSTGLPAGLFDLGIGGP